MGTFLQKLIDNNTAGRYACGGLDPLDAKIPPHLKEMWGEREWWQAWECLLFQSVLHSAEHAAAFKPNIAFFLARGYLGLKVLERLCEHIRTHAPHALLILDMKCGDIGDTNLGYVEFAFKVCGADAVTVHPYMGYEAMAPFLKDPDKGVFVLCRTSNKGGQEFPSYGVTDPVPLYRRVAQTVSEKWNANGNCGLVMGATHPLELELVTRQDNVTLPLLIPGVGKQGGSLEECVNTLLFQGKPTQPFIINQSSTFLYASYGKDFPEASAAVLKKMNDDIGTILHPSGAYRTPA